VRPHASPRRFDRRIGATEDAAPGPETGTFAPDQLLLPMPLLLYGAQRASPPNNHHSLRGLAQANSMCSPHMRHQPQRGPLCLGAAHRILTSYVLWHIDDYVTQETKRSSSPLKYNDLLMTECQFALHNIPVSQRIQKFCSVSFGQIKPLLHVDLLN
jgi:hypothetical protein